MPTWLAPAIGALTSIGSQLLSNKSVSDQNRASREWQEMMYGRQFNDNLRLWRMQNEYNSPQEQMKRFQEAGLNKMLVATQGSAGNAGSIGAPSPGTPEFRPQEFGGLAQGLTSAINQYYDTRLKKAQTDNLKTQNTGMLLDQVNKAIDFKGKFFDYEQKKRLANYQFDLLQEQVRTQFWENRKRIQDWWQSSELHGPRLEQERQKARALGIENEIKQVHKLLWDAGLNPNDPTWLRVSAEMIRNPEKAKKVLDRIGEGIGKFIFGN